jgi:hypothetical protein
MDEKERYDALQPQLKNKRKENRKKERIITRIPQLLILITNLARNRFFITSMPRIFGYARAAFLQLRRLCPFCPQ